MLQNDIKVGVYQTYFVHIGNYYFSCLITERAFCRCMNNCKSFHKNFHGIVCLLFTEYLGNCYTQRASKM